MNVILSFFSQRLPCLVLTIHPGSLRAISPTFLLMVSLILKHIILGLQQTIILMID